MYNNEENSKRFPKVRKKLDKLPLYSDLVFQVYLDLKFNLLHKNVQVLDIGLEQCIVTNDENFYLPYPANTKWPYKETEACILAVQKLKPDAGIILAWVHPDSTTLYYNVFLGDKT